MRPDNRGYLSLRNFYEDNKAITSGQQHLLSPLHTASCVQQYLLSPLHTASCVQQYLLSPLHTASCVQQHLLSPFRTASCDEYQNLTRSEGRRNLGRPKKRLLTMFLKKFHVSCSDGNISVRIKTGIAFYFRLHIVCVPVGISSPLRHLWQMLIVEVSSVPRPVGVQILKAAPPNICSMMSSPDETTQFRDLSPQSVIWSIIANYPGNQQDLPQMLTF